MISRREILVGAIAAIAVQRSTGVTFDVPAGACDCHTHIHGDPKTFPFFSGRSYTPEPALPSEMAALHNALHIQRVVIVTPSVYGTDNSATIYGINARGADARGVAVIDDKTTDDALDVMGRAGIRGIRLNLATGATNDPTVGRQRFQIAVGRMTPRRWHVQMFTNLAVISAIKDLIAVSPVPVVFDHFGGARPELGVGQPGFADLIGLVRSGKAYAKISIPEGPRADYTDFVPLAQALIAANPDRILWGSNWPHPNSGSGRRADEVSPLFQVDDGLVLSQLARWAPEAGIRKKILVDNPARLYEF